MAECRFIENGIIAFDFFFSLTLLSKSPCSSRVVVTGNIASGL